MSKCCHGVTITRMESVTKDFRCLQWDGRMVSHSFRCSANYYVALKTNRSSVLQKFKEDNRTLATKRRKEAYKDKLSIALDTLYRIRNWNIARYVMFDSWFTNADFLISLKEIGFDSVCRAKKKWNQRVLFLGKLHTLAQIYSKCKKTQGKVRISAQRSNCSRPSETCH